MKKFLVFLLVVAVIAGGVYLFQTQLRPAFEQAAPVVQQQEAEAPKPSAPTDADVEELQTAITSGDEEDCSNLENAALQNRCQFYYEQETKAAEQTPEEEAQVEELQTAITSGNEEDCSNLENAALQQRCQFYFEQETKVAEQTPEEEAAEAEEEAQVEELQTAVTSGNEGDCASIESEALRKRCEFYYQQTP